jgi:hypothetical protein
VKAFILSLLIPAMPLPLLAQDIVLKSGPAPASLIELYSSEGCSSCPPAEEWIGQLKNEPGLWKNIFPVAFHVDYWDGLGWPDRFTNAAYTQRQRDYAARLGQDSVYTPEFILNGQEWHRSWFGGDTISSGGAHNTGVLTVTVNKTDGKISADYASSGANANPTPTLNMALLGFNVVTNVRAGENSGRKLEHNFVVLGYGTSPLTADSSGHFHSTPLAIKSSTTDVPGAIVAWVSAPDGSILQVAGGWFASTEQHEK